MILNGLSALKSVSGSTTNGLTLRLSNKTVRKFADLPIYCLRQKCSPGNVVFGSERFLQIFAGDSWRGASHESGVVENGDFRFIRSLSSEYHAHTVVVRTTSKVNGKC